MWILILTVGLAAGFVSYLVTRDMLSRRAEEEAKTQSEKKVGLRVNELQGLPEEPWYGKPAPQPGYYIKELADYSAWREDFRKALAELEKRDKGNAAEALKLWLRSFEATETRRAQINFDSDRPPVISPLFDTPSIRRLIRKPPLPAFEKFRGYKVVLPWNGAVYYYDANPLPADTPYLLHENGIQHCGIPVRTRENIHNLFARAGVKDICARNVLIKASALEGGFDAVNTWDTGCVSVGFVQFTTGESARGHSLLSVLQRMKRNEQDAVHRSPNHADEFYRYFASHGIDVRGGELRVLDPFTRQVLYGAEAVSLIIRDKRIVAIFQDAGAKSVAFQVAQIQEAYGAYYLADRPFRIPMAEISIYDMNPSTSSAPTDTAGIQQTGAELQPIKRRYVYGSDAVGGAESRYISERAFRMGARPRKSDNLVRVVRRVPDLTGVYGDVLTTETGRLVLTDRAIQHGVLEACQAFEKTVAEMAQGQELSLESLRSREGDLILALRNRVDPVIPVAVASRTKAGQEDPAGRTHGVDASQPTTSSLDRRETE